MISVVQKSFENFENLKFHPFSNQRTFLHNSHNPDKNFYNNIQAVNTQCNFPPELLSLSEKLHINSENLSMIQLNIRSVTKNRFLKQAPFLKFCI